MINRISSIPFGNIIPYRVYLIARHKHFSVIPLGTRSSRFSIEISRVQLDAEVRGPPPHSFTCHYFFHYTFISRLLSSSSHAAIYPTRLFSDLLKLDRPSEHERSCRSQDLARVRLSRLIWPLAKGYHYCLYYFTATFLIHRSFYSRKKLSPNTHTHAHTYLCVNLYVRANLNIYL